MTIGHDHEGLLQIEATAARRGLDYVVGTLRRDLAEADPQRGDVDWSQLSAPVFARDWGSDADAIYDELG